MSLAILRWQIARSLPSHPRKTGTAEPASPASRSFQGAGFATLPGSQDFPTVQAIPQPLSLSSDQLSGNKQSADCHTYSNVSETTLRCARRGSGEWFGNLTSLERDKIVRNLAAARQRDP